MKKILFAIVAVIFTSCSKDDAEPIYTAKQQKAFSVFVGTFADYQYSNLGGNDIKGDPDLILFGEQYSEPIELRKDDFMDGTQYMGTAHGECIYKKKLLKDEPYEEVECYYNISYDAENLTLYKKSDKEIYHHYTLFIDSPTEFRLFQSGLPLPYIFKKQ